MSSQAPVQAPAPPLLQHIRVSSAAQLRELLSTFSFPHNGTWFRSSVGHLEVTLDFQLPEDGNLVRNMNRLFNVLLVQQPSPTSPLTRVSVHAQNLESGSNRSIEEFRNIINMLGRWPLGTLARDPNGGIWTSNNNVEVRQVRSPLFSCISIPDLILYRLPEKRALCRCRIAGHR